MKNVPPSSQEATKSMRHKRQQLLTIPLTRCIYVYVPRVKTVKKHYVKQQKNNNTKGKNRV